MEGDVISPGKKVCDCGRPAVARKTVFCFGWAYRLRLCLVCWLIEREYSPEGLELYKDRTGMLYEWT